MTSIIPHSMSTLREPQENFYNKGVVINCNSVLHAIYSLFPIYYNLINMANMQALFNDSTVTIFISTQLNNNDPVSFLNSHTVNGKIDTNILTQTKHMFLYTRSGFNLSISFVNGQVFVNNRLILYSISCKNGVIHLVDSL